MADVIFEKPEETVVEATFEPDPYIRGAYRTTDFLAATPYKGGWIVTERGEHMGFIKKLKSGWKLDPLGHDRRGRFYQACERASRLIDLLKPSAKETLRENPMPAPSCACAPQVALVRQPGYDACLVEADKLGALKTPKKIYEVVRSVTETSEQELLLVVPLDARYRLKGGVIEVHKGATSSVQVSTTTVLRAVLVSGASSFVVCHNHPSGKCSPSRADRELTRHIEKATKILDGEVVFIDHVVVGRKEFYSIREDKLYRA